MGQAMLEGGRGPSPAAVLRFQRAMFRRALTSLILLLAVTALGLQIKLHIVKDGCMGYQALGAGAGAAGGGSSAPSARSLLHTPQPAAADAAASAGREDLPPEWRTHHLFGRSTTDRCPPALLPGSWMNSSAGHGVDGMLPFTAEAQRAIWESQHPRDCASARFLLFKPPASGIGSVLHGQTVALQAALDSGRVLVEAPGTFLAADRWCGPGRRTLDSCYFEPLSNCTLDPEEAAAAPVASSLEQLAAPGGPRVALYSPALAAALRDRSPARFHRLLAETAIPARRRYYWWRAQGVAYAVRPNARTLEELRRRYRLQFRGEPLSPGCVSVYVRHGDKGVEAPTFPDEHYEAVAARLLATDPSLTGQLFVSTEDPWTVEYFAGRGGRQPRQPRQPPGGGGGPRGDRAGEGGGGGAQLLMAAPHEGADGGGGGGGGGNPGGGNPGGASVGRRWQWRTSYVDMPRKPDPTKPNLAYMAEHGFAEEMLDGLLNLDLALQCDGFVGSIFSNWARLIDELRSTVRCKANALYFDAQYRTPAEMDFNW